MSGRQPITCAGVGSAQEPGFAEPIPTFSRPTLAELRTHAHKGHHREIGNWLARRIGRPSAIYGTWLAVRIGLSAHQVTCLALAASLGAAGLIATGERELFVAGVALAHLLFWLDHVDGQVARWRGTASLEGVYFDYLLHHVANLALGFSLGFGLTMQSGEPRWALLGFAIAGGWAVLSLHNDCRYKAFFQRLKSSERCYLVQGGSGGRPAPPAAWPSRGAGVFTWPAYKLCENHAVLLELTILALLAIAAPDVWRVLWRGFVVVMALIAPALGLARASRVIARGAVEDEFDRWLRAVESDQGPRRHVSQPPLPTPVASRPRLSEEIRLGRTSDVGGEGSMRED
jgi:phosphatidylglycerophosphate synthase